MMTLPRPTIFSVLGVADVGCEYLGTSQNYVHKFTRNGGDNMFMGMQIRMMCSAIPTGIMCNVAGTFRYGYLGQLRPSLGCSCPSAPDTQESRRVPLYPHL